MEHRLALCAALDELVVVHLPEQITWVGDYGEPVRSWHRGIHSQPPERR